eukprot:TRINITY_DN40630_c0_g1_i1.p1 TRINITY_DN40630_c0_g1~~TRINITY_DN40630_c0_g1_i1.p1  ORF type:complete len:188 (-),score=49.30 TRINITY_DN40630_c0_g1_i1:317-880(-)
MFSMGPAAMESNGEVVQVMKNTLIEFRCAFEFEEKRALRRSSSDSNLIVISDFNQSPFFEENGSQTQMPKLVKETLPPTPKQLMKKDKSSDNISATDSTEASITAPQELEEIQAEVLDMDLMTIGGQAHPDGCKPCLFYAADKCSKGPACLFCHFAHRRRRIRPSLKTRRKLMWNGPNTESKQAKPA